MDLHQAISEAVLREEETLLAGCEDDTEDLSSGKQWIPYTPSVPSKSGFRDDRFVIVERMVFFPYDAPAVVWAVRYIYRRSGVRSKGAIDTVITAHRKTVKSALKKVLELVSEANTP